MYKKIVAIFITCAIMAACKKGTPTPPIVFGKIEIINKTLGGPDSIITRLNGKDLLPGFARNFDPNLQVLPEKDYELQFYAAAKPDSLLQETTVSIKGNATSSITLFSIDLKDPVKVIDPPVDVSQPGPNEVKLSVANFATDLPEHVDIEVLQQLTSRRPFRYVSAGMIEKVDKATLGNRFSPYVTLPVAISTTTGQPTYDYMLVLKNRDTGEIVLINMPLGSAGTVSATASNRIIRAYLAGSDQNVVAGQL